MAKKPSAAAFANLAVPITTTPTPAPELPASSMPPESRRRGRPPVGSTMREQSVQLGVYVNPAFRRALNIYAAEADIKPHDCLLEALEEWAKRKHINAPVRVQGKQED